MLRSIGLLGVTCIGLNAIVGSGIFALPDDLYRELGALSPLAFALCALGLLPVALCYAEAASSVQETGGPYLYARDAFGPAAGFGVGWMCYANAIFSFAAVASIAAAYALRLFPGLSGTAGMIATKLVALGAIALFSALNYRGARMGSFSVNVFTFSKLAVLAILVGALIPNAEFAALELSAPRGLGGLGAAVFIALFAVQGFEVAPVTAGETHAPQRSVPIAIVGSLLGASALYLVIQSVLVASTSGLGAVSETPLADAALAVNPALGGVIVAGGLISTLGFVAGSALGTPRYLYAAADDGHLPRALAQLHARWISPHVAIAATAVLVIAFVLPFDYRDLIGMSNVAVAVQYLATCVAVLQLRRRGVRPGFRVPGGPAIPLLGCAVSLWIFTEASGVELLWALTSLAVGFGLRALSAGRRGPPLPVHRTEAERPRDVG